MGPLAAVERFLERLFERQSARIFKTAIRPVQVLRRLERVMEGARSRDGGRTVVPHRFVVRLQPDDLAALRASTPSLAADLADGALAFARSHGYTLLDRPVVAIRSDPAVDAGDIAVDASDWGSTSDERDEADGGSGADLDRRGVAGGRSGDVDPVVAEVGPVANGGDVLYKDDPAGQPGRGMALGDRTAVFVVPGIDGPHATIREIRPDQSNRSIAFDGRPLTIGRATDNGLVLRDGRASRHHARIDARRGSLVLSDLGSTNGSYVNDRRVESIALGEGDRIRVGTTTLLIEAIHAPGPAMAADGAADGDGSPDGVVAG